MDKEKYDLDARIWGCQILDYEVYERMDKIKDKINFIGYVVFAGIGFILGLWSTIGW